ncbi:MAG: hypothetical protein IIB75_02535 [Proteobacteria bacterium]|nr:hypothetical protein [Pseudomonadota bacterium]
MIAAFCYASHALTARHLSATESTLALTVYVVTGPFIVSAAGISDVSWLTPDAKGWALLTGAGVCSVIAWVGITNGYRGAPPALLAPLEYTALIGGAIAD